MGINLKGEIIIFSKLRNIVAEIKEDLYSAESERLCNVLNQINFLCIICILIFSYMVGGVFRFIFDLKALGIVIYTFSIIYAISAVIFSKIFSLTLYPSFKILKFLLRYGKVVSKKDWENVRKYCKRLYKDLISKESEGFCYFYSWALAMYLKDAKLMYCTIQVDGRPSGHSVIVKNNCVYDTNDKRHYEYNEYIQKRGVQIYKFFSKNEYKKDNFFDDIREEFVEWCKENNAYCNPQ